MCDLKLCVLQVQSKLEAETSPSAGRQQDTSTTAASHSSAPPAAERGALLRKHVARTMGGATMGELMAQARAAGISVADIEECLNENLLAPKEALAALTQRRVSFCIAGCECYLYCRRARAMRVTSRAADRGG